MDAAKIVPATQPLNELWFFDPLLRVFVAMKFFELETNTYARVCYSYFLSLSLSLSRSVAFFLFSLCSITIEA